MHNIEPFYRWQKYYDSSVDKKSPFFGKEYNFELFTDTIYGYFISPGWDYIGSETLYVKIIFADYKFGCAIIECIGEWNDALHNDIMHFKRNLIDILVSSNINKFIIIGENVFNFHGSDDCYYEEWFEDCEDGWVAFLGFRDFIHREWRKFGIDCYINYGGDIEMDNWRTFTPQSIIQKTNELITKRLA